MPKPLFAGSSRACGKLRWGRAFAACGGAQFRVSPSFVINLMTAFRERGAITPKGLGGRRHSKLDPRRLFILRRVAEYYDIRMPELAGGLHAASGVKADPASLSR